MEECCVSVNNLLKSNKKECGVGILYSAYSTVFSYKTQGQIIVYKLCLISKIEKNTNKFSVIKSFLKNLHEYEIPTKKIAVR